MAKSADRPLYRLFGRLSRPVFEYSLATISIALAMALSVLLNPLHGDKLPYATAILALLLTAWYGGWRPATLALIFGAIMEHFFVLPAHQGTDVVDGSFLYLCVGSGIVLLGASMHRAQVELRTDRA